MRVNEKIKGSEVRVINPDGIQLGIMSSQQALQTAMSLGLDLVEVAPEANPPVCRIMDFSKYKYEQQKKEREAKKHQKGIHTKEIRLKPHIEDHYYQVKLKKLLDFLAKGNKVKVGMFFKGREMAHQELGQSIIKRLIQDMGSHGKLEKEPMLEGRVIHMLLAPK